MKTKKKKQKQISNGYKWTKQINKLKNKTTATTTEWPTKRNEEIITRATKKAKNSLVSLCTKRHRVKWDHPKKLLFSMSRKKKRSIHEKKNSKEKKRTFWLNCCSINGDADFVVVVVFLWSGGNHQSRTWNSAFCALINSHQSSAFFYLLLNRIIFSND